MRSLKVAALLVSVAFASPAFAQDDAPDRFTGFYFGGSLGVTLQETDENETTLFDRNLDGVFGDTVTTTTGANAFAPTAAVPGAGFCSGTVNGPNRPLQGCQQDEQSVEYSARIGYDQQFNNFVAGFVVEFGRTEARSDQTSFSTTPASYTISREIDFTIDLRARAGFTVTPRTLVYATAGGSYAKLDQDFFTTNTANSNVGRGGENTYGFVGGAGVEHLFGDNISVGIEYLYRMYQDDEFLVRLGPGSAPATNPFLLGNPQGTDFRRSSDDFQLHSVRAVIGFRFR